MKCFTYYENKRTHHKTGNSNTVELNVNISTVTSNVYGLNALIEQQRSVRPNYILSIRNVL